ncbi:MAG: hypothetical protein Q7U28_10295 [Aquabacterium sp.]|nr:hypothetical protein [Aquabacterium sp.]
MDSPHHFVSRALSGACLVLSLLIGTSQSVAQTTQKDSLRLNGFGTVGMSVTDAPGSLQFRRDMSNLPDERSPTLKNDSRLGLQLHYDANPYLELVSQLVFKHGTPAVDKPADALAWLFAAYRPSSDITIRVGRTNTDIFLLSDYRDVGFAYPWVRPNVEVYSALPLYSLDGIDVSKTWEQGDARWKLKGFVGQTQTYGTIGRGPDDVFNFKLDKAWGALISREQDGLLLRATLGRAKTTTTASDVTNAALSFLHSLQSLPYPDVVAEASQLENALGIKSYMATFGEVGFSYDRDDWLLSGEYTVAEAKSGTRASRSAYVSAGRRLGDFTLFAMTGWQASKLGIIQAPNWQALGPDVQMLGQTSANSINGSRVKQRSLSLGMRWEFHPQIALKVQVDRFWVESFGSGLWVGSEQQQAHPFVATTALDFVF